VKELTETKIIDDDIVKLYKYDSEAKDKNIEATLFWGDKVDVIEKTGDFYKIDYKTRKWGEEKGKYVYPRFDAKISGETKFREKPLLKIRFIDVGQGDASIIESPMGKLLMIDGGEDEDFYHYVSSAWAQVLRYQPLEAEAIVITHGDADHFAGMTKLLEKRGRGKQPIVNIKMVYHNGIVKAPDGVGDANLLGKTVTIGELACCGKRKDMGKNP
jgi:hypothetical protein